jgi:ADP-ribosylglycohydrolase
MVFTLGIYLYKMKKSKAQILSLFLFATICFSCAEKGKNSNAGETAKFKLKLTKAQLDNKVLGMLVGSAIGDAMGAPTEMWSREAIKLEYGHVVDLDSMVREVSPEGTWVTNLPAGGTTDDTRWKKLTFEYLINQRSKELDARSFSQKILTNYQEAIDNYKKIKSFDPEPFEENTLKVAWLQEWAKVAKPFVENKPEAFHDALNKFYGGEMVCAGLLYSPAIGAFYPEQPELAYSNTHKISIFDIGYARDISSVVAAMTAASMAANPSKESVMGTLRIDPNDYFKSRLVGRSSYKLYRSALYIVDLAKKSKNPMETAFAELDKQNQDMPFHAGEIYLQVLTAILFSDFDYAKTMEFLVNYGRDNDTTAAIAGGILGAFHGFEKLPADKNRVIKVCKEKLDIDLKALAQQLSDKIWELK